MAEDEKLVERVSMAICMVVTGDPDTPDSWADEARAAPQSDGEAPTNQA